MLVLILTVAAVAAEGLESRTSPKRTPRPRSRASVRASTAGTGYCLKTEDEVSVSVGGTVELTGAELGVLGVGPDVLGAELPDVRWTWMNETDFKKKDKTGFVVTRKRKGECKMHCDLLEDGTLRLKDVRISDSGVYEQEVFYAGKCLSKKSIRLTVYGHKPRGRIYTGGEGSQVWSRGWTPLGVSLILILLLIVIFIRRKRASSATNQSRDKDPQCLEENLYVPMFRAKDPESQNQDQTQNSPRTKSESQSPSDPGPRCLEENLYASVFRGKNLDRQTQDHTRTLNSPETKSESQSPSDPGDIEEDIYV
ncbi:uncharacterized protein LOC110159877 isoform X2 [Boleophthalmus pectinirostris]|uniref:uncharacterized protein LOC110159877 isoform X2 n=1 Tax=Boleophthalmus pectinirostris TaxID=150288 RepID=UPI000A1C696C|nr:uncharacterized protein LOC110159877 isoform X2 [Boleophthalmus pectinirostris]